MTLCIILETSVTIMREVGLVAHVCFAAKSKQPKDKVPYSCTDALRQCTHCGIIFLGDSSENKRHDTLDKKCSRDATTVTRDGSSPISSLDSLNAVAASSASPSSAFPPGKETSPEIPDGGNKS